VLKNKHQAVSQGGYKPEARGSMLERVKKNQTLSDGLSASGFQLPADTK
jgi:hypothetical protein